MRFAKAHGTGNDFVLLPDPDGEIELTPALVATLCDRRRGIGGDGVLRVVRSAKHPEAAHLAGDAEWFMDYVNGDGSPAQMCGNGVRAYARFMVSSGLVPADSTRLPIATRAGVVVAEIGPELITVDMVVPVVGPPSTAVLGGTRFEGISVQVGNPNLVCWVDDPARLDLARAPELDPDLFPAYGNTEFIAAALPVEGADAHVVMRVYERGSGETMSCGSGACAVAAAVLAEEGRSAGMVAIDVPGGRLSVRLDDSGCHLTGPAVVVATGEIDVSAL
jgi:diaminopimelate epimerase